MAQQRTAARRRRVQRQRLRQRPRIQETRFEGRYIASDLYNPDLMKLADAFGVAARRADSPSTPQTELRAALAAEEPTLIEVPVGAMPSMAGQQRAAKI